MNSASIDAQPLEKSTAVFDDRNTLGRRHRVFHYMECYST